MELVKIDEEEISPLVVKVKNNALVLSSSVAAFGMTTAVLLGSPFLISVGLSVLAYFGIFFTLNKLPDEESIKRKLNFESTEIKKLQTLYTESLDNVIELQLLVDELPNGRYDTVRPLAKELGVIGEQIMSTVRKNEEDLSDSRYFLSAILPKAVESINNYNKILESNVSIGVKRESEEETMKILEILKKEFIKQRDSFSDRDLMQMRIERQFLEQKIEKQRNVLDKEDN